MENNHFGHDPEGKVSAFMKKHSGFKVSIKLWGKKAKSDSGERLNSHFIRV